MTEFTRRSLLAGSAAAALAAPPAQAAAPAIGKQGAGIYRYKIGSYELTALYDGTWFRTIDDKFVRNASAAEVRQGADRRVPAVRACVPTSFTALLVNTGSKLVLIDTGTAGQLGATAGLMPNALAAAGVAAERRSTRS